MRDKFLYIFLPLIPLFLAWTSFYYLNWNYLQKSSSDSPTPLPTSATTQQPSTQEYSFSNGTYKISFTAAKNALVESRHAGDIKRTIREMRDFLGTTSYQQSTTPNSTTTAIHCAYATYTGTYLGDPYCKEASGKCNYSKEDIQKLTDAQIVEAYNGKWLRAKIQGTDYAPYPNFSILDTPDTCSPPTITYSRNDDYATHFYIYSGKVAQGMIQRWKAAFEWSEMIGLTQDGYKQYVFTAAIWSKHYYIELNNGDILSTGTSYHPEIRVQVVERAQ